MTLGNARARTREELSAAALRLFSEQGHDSTTVDKIVAEAGVGRRTFFRYFRTKEDAAFPDHDSTVATVSSVLRNAADDADPLEVICRGVSEVLRMYAAEPAVSLARYQLLRRSPALREREIAVVSRYERLFAKYLLAHPATTRDPDKAMWAEVSAAAVVTAHNHVLRGWLRAGAEGDVEAQLEQALRTVRNRLAADPSHAARRALTLSTLPLDSLMADGCLTDSR